MSAPQTLDLDALAALLAAATPGPWAWEHVGEGNWCIGTTDPPHAGEIVEDYDEEKRAYLPKPEVVDFVCEGGNMAPSNTCDAALIVALVNAAPALLDAAGRPWAAATNMLQREEAHRLEAERDEARAAVAELHGRIGRGSHKTVAENLACAIDGIITMREDAAEGAREAQELDRLREDMPRVVAERDAQRDAVRAYLAKLPTCGEARRNEPPCGVLAMWWERDINGHRVFFCDSHHADSNEHPVGGAAELRALLSSLIGSGVTTAVAAGDIEPGDCVAMLPDGRVVSMHPKRRP